MKSKIYKLLSILLAVMIVFTTGAIALNVTANTQAKEYFVKTGANGTGTQESPFGNIGAAVTAAVNSGYTAGDTVTVTVTESDTAEWGTFPSAFGFKLILRTASGKTAAVALPAKTCLAGDTEFVNITVNAGGSWPSRKVFFGGHNVKFAADATLNTDYVAYGNENGNATFSDQTVRFEGTLKSKPTYVYLNNETGGNVTREGDINLKLNSANGEIAPSGNYGTTTVTKNVNLDLTAIASTKLHDFGSAGGWTINGALQIVCKENFTLTNEALLTTFAPVGGVYKIINSTGLENLFEFVSGTAGKYKLLADTNRFTFTVKDGNGTSYPIQTEGGDSFIVLPAGGGTFTVTADKLPETKEYYVSANGKAGNDGTKESPFLGIADAVNAANVYGMTAKDSVTLTVLGTEQISWGAVPAYSFKMTVRAETEGTAASIAMSDNTELSGDVSFKDIKLTAKGLLFNDHDVTFDKGTEYSVDYPAFGTKTTASTVDGQTVIYKGKVYAPYTKITNDASGNKTYTDDVNITVDNAEANLGFYIKSNYGNTTYTADANLNIDIKNAKAIKFIDVGGSITHNGAIQVIHKQGFQVAGKELITAANPAKGVYWIIDNSGSENLLEFTDTEGKFKVNSQYDVIAVSSADSSETKAKDGYLTLETAGEYVITVDRPAVTKDYYVSADGITVEAGTRPETAGTKENPVKTVADATRLIAQDPLNGLDVANIIISADAPVEWGSNAVNYAPLAVIRSETDEAVAVINTNVGTVFTGNTEFRSIKLVQQNNNAGISFGHYNVKLDSASEFVTNYISLGGVTSPGTVTEDQKIEIYGKVDSMEFKLAPGYGNTVYKNKINIIADNPETVLNIRFGARANTTTNYDGEIYVDVKNAKSISFANVIDTATVNVNGSISLIVNKAVQVTQAVKTNFKNIEAGGGKWYITNYSSDPDLLSFGDTAGEFDVKDNKKVYVRQYEVEKMDIITGGVVALDSGEYVISDEEIPYLNSDLHKMLYFRNSGHLQDLYVRLPVTPGETYVFEYSVWSSRYEDLKPTAKQNGDYRWTLSEVVITSEKQVENYYKIVCETTVPTDYAYPTAFFGVELFPFDEGYIFDVSVYNKKDSEKTNIMPNNNLHSGLDYWAVGYEFWGAIFSGEKGGSGRLEFNGNTKLKVVNFSVDTIQELIDACSPNDGKWWKDSQVKADELYVAYVGSVKGTLKDTNGNPLADHKIVLTSANNTYTAKTDSKGAFRFTDKIVADYYELIVITKNGKEVTTDYGMHMEEQDKVTFDLVVDYGESYVSVNENKDDETVNEEQTETVPSGTLIGTVYTPLLDTVPNLKVYLEGIGEAVTDGDGKFAFSDVPAGEYSLYTVLENGEKYEFRKVTIKPNVKLEVKLKYDPAISSDADGADNGWVIWIIVASVVALVVIAGLIVFILFKKKRIE